MKESLFIILLVLLASLSIQAQKKQIALESSYGQHVNFNLGGIETQFPAIFDNEKNINTKQFGLSMIWNEKSNHQILTHFGSFENGRNMSYMLDYGSGFSQEPARDHIFRYYQYGLGYKYLFGKKSKRLRFVIPIFINLNRRNKYTDSAFAAPRRNTFHLQLAPGAKFRLNKYFYIEASSNIQVGIGNHLHPFYSTGSYYPLSLGYLCKLGYNFKVL